MCHTRHVRHNMGVEEPPAGPAPGRPSRRPVHSPQLTVRITRLRDAGQLTQAARLARFAHEQSPHDPVVLRLYDDVGALLLVMSGLGFRPMPEDGQAKQCGTCPGRIFGHKEAIARQCLRCQVMAWPPARPEVNPQLDR